MSRLKGPVNSNHYRQIAHIGHYSQPSKAKAHLILETAVKEDQNGAAG